MGEDQAVTLTIPARFRGPARSGNGGWSAGALASYVDAPSVTVRLRRPPPLDAPLLVEERDGWTVASDGGEVVLQARPAAGELVAVAPVDRTTALAAEASFAGSASHPFPTCFSCGPRDDGLRIFPGPVGPGRVAATWTPDAAVTVPITWAAIDCAGAWAAGMAERAMVLGQFTARVDTLPVAGEEHVVVGEMRGGEGRKVLAATSTYDADGRLVATAEAIWFLIDPDAFN